jgi:cellulose synthase/poly-beta-1,6-N-acetylglucosamine synthase-like glycosyltransferase
MSDPQSLLLALFVLLLTFRYLRAVVSIFTFNLYKPKPVHDKPSYTGRDVTVIVPTTFKLATELTRCLQRISVCSPAAILIVTAHANVDLIRHICSLQGFCGARVLGIDKLNKRRQMVLALKEVKTNIVVFADDDVFWPERYLDYLLAIFEDPMTGAGGTRQRARRNPGTFINFWNFLGIAYLERRVWNNITTNAVDGSISTLSGRTAAYRSDILATEEFYQYFQNDSWRGRPLNSDDDKCLTRYVYSHGWDITIQSDPRSVIETTLEDNPKYISQCLRWARAHWRGNFTVMENEKYWRSKRHWFGCYAIYISSFQTPAILVDGLLFGLLVAVMRSSTHAVVAYSSFGTWVLFTKVFKLIPHFLRYPQDTVFIPVSILFSYLHGLLNVYAFFTLTKTHWGSQKLEALEHVRARNEEVIPLLKTAMTEGEQYKEPTPGRRLISRCGERGCADGIYRQADGWRRLLLSCACRLQVRFAALKLHRTTQNMHHTAAIIGVVKP